MTFNSRDQLVNALLSLVRSPGIATNGYLSTQQYQLPGRVFEKFSLQGVECATITKETVNLSRYSPWRPVLSTRQRP